MKWYKSFRSQVLECKKTGNRFLVKNLFVDGEISEVIACVPYKSFCDSCNCFEKRKEKGI